MNKISKDNKSEAADNCLSKDKMVCLLSHYTLSDSNLFVVFVPDFSAEESYHQNQWYYE